MSERAWLKQVLADANVSNQSRPDWAKNSSKDISLNSQPESNPGSDAPAKTSGLTGTKSAGQDGLNLK
jgi:hypothetical protein